MRAAAESILGTLVGREDATFRADQWEAIERLIAGHRVLVVQRTGWGKSAVYFVASGLLRERGAGPTLIVSPLLALMRNQVEAAQRAGIRARTVNSSNVTEWEPIETDLAAGAVDVLLVSPERLNNPEFRERWLPRLSGSVGLVVVDEAHCISDWGHDFRPDYRRIRDLLQLLPVGTPVLATTATANARVVADVSEQLASGGREVVTLRGSLDRESLRLGVLRLPGADKRIGWLGDHLGDLQGSGIIYTLTVSTADEVAAFLRGRGHEVASYTGRTDDAERLEAEQALLHNKVKALVATSALGMGFDKPDLGFVVHLGAPQSPIAYYQQVGRAGRGVERADVLLLPGHEDEEIWRYFASLAFPSEQQARAVLDTLGGASGPLSTATLETRVDVRRTRLELLLKVLDVDGVVRRVRGGWEATGAEWFYDADRYSRVAATRAAEQQAMRDYVRLPGCRLEFLRRQLDDPWAGPCGRCDGCAGPWYPLDVTEQARAVAAAELSRPGVELEPRALWPQSMDRLGVPVRGRIDPAERAAPGRAVARLSDLGLGTRARSVVGVGAPDTVVPDDIVVACVEVLRHWTWEQRPAAVVAMPSRTRPRLIASLARRIGEVGRLPVIGSLGYAHGGPTGAPGSGNSAFRLAAVWDRIVVPAQVSTALAELGPSPVLLVDDMCDSRWTMTVAARELRRAGADSVLPLVVGVAA